MTTYGVTATGFVKKPLADILASYEASLLALYPTLDLSPETPLGQILGIMATSAAERWELLETSYNANDRDKAEFYLLDAVGALTGTPRVPASYSKVVLSCALTSGTVLTSGVAKANVAGSPLDLWTPVTTYTAATTGTFPVTFQASTTGARAANPGTITAISTPISGWSTVTNALAAVPGADAEEDPDYRERQVEELAAGGSSTVPAISAGLLALPGMVQVIVEENTTNATAGDGLPAHTIWPIVFDGIVPALSNDAIAQALWANKGGGIGYFGTTTGNAVDSTGVTRVMNFDRATQRNVYIAITVKTNAKFDVVNGPAAVKAALTSAGFANLALGSAVLENGAIRAGAFVVPGVVAVNAFALDFTASPTATLDLSVGAHEIAVLDPTRIVVTVT